MLKIILLACALLGILTALTLEAWIRSRIVKGESTNKVVSELRSRNSEFWSIQYLPAALLLAVTCAAVSFGISPVNAAALVSGGIVCFVSIVIGSKAMSAGSAAAASLALSGDVRNSLRSCYRSGAVMGLTLSSIALIGIGSLFFLFKTKQLISVFPSFALGASVTAMSVGLSGTVFSSAYSLNVKKNDYSDYTGLFAGRAADCFGTIILSACSAVLLAGVGVDTSGVMSTFTRATAARYPVIILASGIVASVIGVFIYRGNIVKNPAAGVTVGNIVAAVIVTAVAAYFSNRMMQTYIYAVCAAAGLAASLISAEISKLFSSDGIAFKRHIPDAKKTGLNQSMIYSLSFGMLSQCIPTMLTLTAMVISYKFANFYGIALAAAGAAAVSAISYAASGFSVNAAGASEIVYVSEKDTDSPAASDVLLTASVRSDVTGRTYSSVACMLTLVALYAALSVTAKNQSASIMTTRVFAGMMTGAVATTAVAGLMIRALRLTGTVLRDRLKDQYVYEKRINALRGLIPLYIVAVLVPAAIGLAGGVEAVLGFACASTLTCILLMFVFNGSGRYYDRITTEALGTAVKTMTVISVVFAAFFIRFGGFFF